MVISNNARSRLSLLTAISCFYLVCIIIFFYPSFHNFTSALIGPPEDNMQDFWNTWYSQISFESHPFSLFHTNLLFYPEGVSLVYHSFAYPNLFLIFAIRKILFLPLTIATLVGMHNLMLLVSYYLSAIGGFYLAKHYTNDNLSSLLGGFIFGFSPFHFAHTLHHMGVAAIQYIPFFVLCFLSFLETRNWKPFIGAVIFYWLSALSCWYYLFYIAYFLLFYYCFEAVQKRTFLTKRLLKPILAIFASVILLLSPIVMPMISQSIGNPNVYTDGHNVYVADLLAFFVFHPYHLLNTFTEGINSHFSGNAWEMTVYLGIINIGLILWWLMKKQKSYPIQGLGYHLWGMIIFMLFAGGSFLHIYGETTPIPLPTFLTQFIPFFRNVRTPSRAIVFSYLFLSIAIAMITSKNMSLIGGRRGIIFFAAVSALVFADFYPSGILLTKVDCPQAYEIIKRDTDSRTFGILDVPRGYIENNRYMMYQVCHGRPIVEASISRKLSLTLDDALEMKDLLVQRKQLMDRRVKYVIVHKDLNKAILPELRISVDAYVRQYPVVYSDSSEIVMRVY